MTVCATFPVNIYRIIICISKSNQTQVLSPMPINSIFHASFSFPAFGLSFICVSLCMLPLYAERRKCQSLYYKNIAQKSAVDFMQIDGIKIPASYDGQPGKVLYIICCC